jgi:hypothetical protein
MYKARVVNGCWFLEIFKLVGTVGIDNGCCCSLFISCGVKVIRIPWRSWLTLIHGVFFVVVIIGDQFEAINVDRLLFALDRS